MDSTLVIALVITVVVYIFIGNEIRKQIVEAHKRKEEAEKLKHKRRK